MCGVLACSPAFATVTSEPLPLNAASHLQVGEPLSDSLSKALAESGSQLSWELGEDYLVDRRIPLQGLSPEEWVRSAIKHFQQQGAFEDVQVATQGATVSVTRARVSGPVTYDPVAARLAAIRAQQSSALPVTSSRGGSKPVRATSMGAPVAPDSGQPRESGIEQIKPKPERQIPSPAESRKQASSQARQPQAQPSTDRAKAAEPLRSPRTLAPLGAAAAGLVAGEVADSALNEPASAPAEATAPAVAPAKEPRGKQTVTNRRGGKSLALGNPEPVAERPEPKLETQKSSARTPASDEVVTPVAEKLVEAIPLPAPEVVPAAPEWVAAHGATLRSTIEDWSRKAGWVVTWNDERPDLRVIGTVRTEGSFTDAVKYLFDVYHRSGATYDVTLYAEQKLVLVRNK